MLRIVYAVTPAASLRDAAPLLCVGPIGAFLAISSPSPWSPGLVLLLSFLICSRYGDTYRVGMKLKLKYSMECRARDVIRPAFWYSYMKHRYEDERWLYIAVSREIFPCSPTQSSTYQLPETDESVVTVIMRKILYIFGPISYGILKIKRKIIYSSLSVWEKNYGQLNYDFSIRTLCKHKPINQIVFLSITLFKD